jgi:hypothetical protein
MSRPVLAMPRGAECSPSSLTRSWLFGAAKLSELARDTFLVIALLLDAPLGTRQAAADATRTNRR